MVLDEEPLANARTRAVSVLQSRGVSSLPAGILDRRIIGDGRGCRNRCLIASAHCAAQIKFSASLCLVQPERTTGRPTPAAQSLTISGRKSSWSCSNSPPQKPPARP